MSKSKQKPVVVYGASGYTGRLVCEYLRQYEIPFVAAGRNAERLEEIMQKVPGIETADYEVRAVDHDTDALTKLFEGSSVVRLRLRLAPHTASHGISQPRNNSLAKSRKQLPVRIAARNRWRNCSRSFRWRSVS